MGRAPARFQLTWPTRRGRADQEHRGSFFRVTAAGFFNSLQRVITEATREYAERRYLARMQRRKELGIEASVTNLPFYVARRRGGRRRRAQDRRPWAARATMHTCVLLLEVVVVVVRLSFLLVLFFSYLVFLFFVDLIYSTTRLIYSVNRWCTLVFFSSLSKGVMFPRRRPTDLQGVNTINFFLSTRYF